MTVCVFGSIGMRRRNLVNSSSDSRMCSTTCAGVTSLEYVKILSSMSYCCVLNMVVENFFHAALISTFVDKLRT
jgi:hypothetical protein